jgi:hypothetical protein
MSSQGSGDVAAPAASAAAAIPRGIITTLCRPAATDDTTAAGPSRKDAPAGTVPAPPQQRQQPAPRAAKRKRRERKTLTARGKRAAVVRTLAEPPPGSQAAPPAAAPEPPAPAGAAAPAAATQSVEAATVNLGRAWSKADVAKLARLAEDPNYLRTLAPDHPPGADIDFELLSRHFGRRAEQCGRLRPALPISACAPELKGAHGSSCDVRRAGRRCWCPPAGTAAAALRYGLSTTRWSAWLRSRDARPRRAQITWT